jgi:hypothetical protein
MNHTFERKPISVEAFQITKETRKDNKDWPIFLNRACQRHNTEPNSVYPSEFPDSEGEERLAIMTINGEKIVEWGDWIVDEVDGIAVITDEEFKKNYNPTLESAE